MVRGVAERPSALEYHLAVEHQAESSGLVGSVLDVRLSGARYAQ